MFIWQFTVTFKASFEYHVKTYIKEVFIWDMEWVAFAEGLGLIY